MPQEVRHVPRILSEAGVRFILVQALPNTRIDGVCFWLEHVPVVALTLRFDRIDSFWFTLFHELRHVLSGEDSLDTDLDKTRQDDDRPDSEKLADQFAVENLIPQTKLANFIARVRPLCSTKRIEAFAQTMQVHPSIVVGQLQHRGEISWANLRSMLIPVREWIAESALTDGWGSALPVQVDAAHCSS